MIEEKERGVRERKIDIWTFIRSVADKQALLHTERLCKPPFQMDFLHLRWICSNNLYLAVWLFFFSPRVRDFIWCHSRWVEKSRWNESPFFSILLSLRSPPFLFSFALLLWWKLNLQNWESLCWLYLWICCSFLLAGDDCRHYLKSMWN